MFTPFETELVKVIRKRNTKASDAELREWFDSQTYWANWNNRNSQEWVDELGMLISGDKDSINIYRFFMLVYGVLIDLYPTVDSKLHIFRDKNGEESVRDYITRTIVTDAEMRGYLLIMLDICESLELLENSFSDELVFSITFFRNKYCHPGLDKYKVKLRKSLIVDAKMYVAFLKAAPLEELDVFEEAYNILKTNLATLNKLVADFKIAIRYS